MSEQSVIALAAVITSGVLGVASLAFSFWNSSSERRQRLKDRREDNKEWYRRTLFERRLEVIHEASQWLDPLKDAIQDAIQPDPELTDNPGLFLLNTAEKARQWYGKNFLYIHGGMPRECAFGGFLLAVYSYARGYGGMPEGKLWQEASDLLKQKALELLQPLAGGKGESA
jgi:hypothetical protein